MSDEPIENAAVDGAEVVVEPIAEVAVGPVAQATVEPESPRRGRPPKVIVTNEAAAVPVNIKPYKLAKGAIVTGSDGVRVKWEDMANYTVNLDDDAAKRLIEAGIVLA